MEHNYPQEFVGTTLSEERTAVEYERVYLVQHSTYWEVGEITYGTHTRAVYGESTHLHSIQVDVAYGNALTEALSVGRLVAPWHLVDLMDALDERQVPYGYLNTEVGSHVSYRPARTRRMHKAAS